MNDTQEILSDSKRSLLTKSIPVLEHIEQLKVQKITLKDEFDKTNLKLNQIKQDVIKMETDMCRTNEYDLNFLLEKIVALDKDFRLYDKKDESELNYLKNQITSLNNDKFKIAQNVILLEERIQRIDNEIGFDIY